MILSDNILLMCYTFCSIDELIFCQIATQQLRQIEVHYTASCFVNSFDRRDMKLNFDLEFCVCQTEKSMWEEKKKNEEEDMVKLMKQNDQYNLEISALKQELETTKRKYEQQYSQIESQTKVGTLYAS